MTKLIATLIVAAGLLAGTAQAATAPLAYRTDEQAGAFLQNRLATWGGVNLRAQDYRFAFCINGYYSKTEQRNRRHFPQDRTTAAGEYLFHSFACTLSSANHEWHLYVIALPHYHWSVKADR